jgi:ethanolamine ammonia-lyase large subunit
MVNNVSGFIGPETLYDGKEMIRANLEDHFMGKLLGLPMGMAPCYTNHTSITQDDQELVLATDAAPVRVAKQPFAITFTTPDGAVINQDEPGLTTSWIGEEVATYKKMQEGERFIGLGEKTASYGDSSRASEAGSSSFAERGTCDARATRLRPPSLA